MSIMNLTTQTQVRSIFKIKHGLAIVLTLTLLGGCALGPNYKRPSVDTPSAYRFDESQATNSLGDLPWWQVFKDPVLQDLIQIALTNNLDIRQAVARVEQARQQVVVARAPLFPQVGYGGDIGRGKNAILNTPSPNNGATLNSGQFNLNAVWEIDFWGRIRRLTEAARAQFLGTEEARGAVTITVKTTKTKDD
jgi:multidrug efflux system outer membrane protein